MPVSARQHLFFFFFNDTATTEIYTLSLHDALPISGEPPYLTQPCLVGDGVVHVRRRSEEHTSELQSRSDLVCRLLLEKKTKNKAHQDQQTQQHWPAHTTVHPSAH